MTFGLRVKVFAAILGFAAAGIVLLVLGLGTLVSLIGAVSARAEIIALAPRDLLALPLSISFLALAGLPFCVDARDAVPRRKRSPAKRGVDPAAILFTIALAGLLLSVAIPPTGGLVIAAILRERGYRSCPPPQQWERHPPLRWARAGARCP